MKAIDYKRTHDYKHWLKIYGGDKKSALEAVKKNTFGFCCFFEDAMKYEKRKTNS